MPRPVWGLLLVSLWCCLTVGSPRSPLSLADEASGCPSWGCTASGTFALSSDIPGTDNRQVGIKWTTVLSSVALDQLSTQLGCVSCQAPSVVCSTSSGYVAIDQTNGTVLWQYNNMTSPSLPIMNIFGDIIGTDGKKLIKINSDGSLEPIITIHDGLSPMYSVMLADNSQFLMTSYVDSVLITYGTDGVPEAAYTVKDEVNKVNGTFYTIAQPVLSGMRAYILMQFVPNPDTHPQAALAVAGLRRLYAVDLWVRMAKRISPVWYFNLGRTPHHRSSASRSPPSVQTATQTVGSEPRNNGSVLVSNDIVYVSVAGLAEDEEGTLWAIRDEGNFSKLIFQTSASVSALSLYDVSFKKRPPLPYRGNGIRSKSIGSEQAKWPKKEKNKTNPSAKEEIRRWRKLNLDRKPIRQSGAEILWAATSQRITGYSSADGTVEYSVDVCQDVLKVRQPCRITSKVMVAHSDDDQHERLVFAVAVNSSGHREASSHRGVVDIAAIDSSSTTPFVVALEVGDAAGVLRPLWKLAGTPGTEIVGQIANVVYMPASASRPNQRTASDGRDSFGTASLPEPQDVSSYDKPGTETEAESQRAASDRVMHFQPQHQIADDDDVEVVLVAAAVSDKVQMSIAIGRV